jgi:acylphosphatase
VTKRVRVVVSGRVQGVFFRVECERRARALELAGWVRNLGDGRVEAVFEGRAADVEAAIAWCREGPPGARVTDVEILDEPLAGDGEFRIR